MTNIIASICEILVFISAVVFGYCLGYVLDNWIGMTIDETTKDEDE